jgi:hypothetical protein
MKIIKNPFVVEKYQGEDLYLILDNNVHILTGITPFIWEKIGPGISRKELLEIILDEYDVVEKKADKDLSKVLKKLKFINVLESIDE